MIFCVEDNASVRLWNDAGEEEIKKLCETLGDEVLRGENIDAERLSHPVECSLFLVDEDEIRELNHAHRGVDRVTDVLSFPGLLFSADESAAMVIDGAGADDMDPETGHVLLGEIVVCTARALKQADEFGHGIQREFAFLVTHSLLHLMGYDHETEEDRMVMERKQEAVLTALHITRERSGLG